MRASSAFRFAWAFALFAACAPIDGTPRSTAPVNACPEHSCDAYQQTKTKATCSSGRCELIGKPDYPYTLVVTVPDTSFFAAGVTFALQSGDFLTAKGTPKCPPITCLALPPLADVTGEYRTTAAAAVAVGRNVGGAATIPMHATLRPLMVADDGTIVDAIAAGLPLEPIFSDTVATADGAGPLGGARIEYRVNVASGRYQRISVPDPPFDDAFPPIVDVVAMTPKATDVFTLGVDPHSLDEPPGGTSRLAQVTRMAGLEGWRAWLEDSKTGLRISPSRPLSGSHASARLDTVNFTQPGTPATIRDGIDIVVAPPPSAVGIPTLKSRVINNIGLTQEYPQLPPPVSVSGTVASKEGMPARLIFECSDVSIIGSDKPSKSLHYRTSLDTDQVGRFATVLPPGLYDVSIQPDPATGFARTDQALEVASTITNAVLSPAKRAIVQGSLFIGDGRPLAEATILATPAAASRSSLSPSKWPRAARTETASAGTFVFELDVGEYDLSVVPTAGTGFPRLVSPSHPIVPGSVDFDKLTVSAPTRIAYTIQDPSGNAIARAVVRAFAVPAGATLPVEIGEAMTDTSGRFELLLSPLPR